MGLGWWGSTEDKFARQVLAAIQRAGVSDARYDAGEFAIRRDATGHTLFLHNVFRETRGLSRSDRRARIDVVVRAVLLRVEPPNGWEANAPLLRTALRAVTFGQGMPAPLLARPAGVPYLNECVVIDLPDTISYVLPSTVREWGVPVEEVFLRARANVAAASTTLGGPAAGGGRALIRFVETGNEYWASRLLLCGGLVQLRSRLGERPVAFVADTTGVLVAADSPDLVALFGLVEQQFREAVRPVSPQAYTVDADGRLTVYAPPADHPAAPKVRRAARLLALAEYSHQTEALQASVGDDVYVGAPIVVERDGLAISIASWADVPSLLPEADYVVFSGATAPRLTVPFDTAVRLAGLVPEAEPQPVRYRVSGWPSPSTMEQLRAHAVELS